jgi:hypothetical protein
VVRWRREPFDIGAEPVVTLRHRRSRQRGIGLGDLHEGADWQASVRARPCEDFLGIVTEHQLEPLAITVEHGRLAGRMAGTHKDPFDRILAAQALIEDVPLLTNDPAFAPFGVKVVW